jgi:glycosyltransferase involved in cell wall biosynthesis
MLSFIVPAHNEQAYLERTLLAIHESARDTGQEYEIIVVDDASTDETASIARQQGATVVAVNHRQIAATRNAGADVARGEWFFFVDADTIIQPRVLISALKHLEQGAAGGGAPVRFEGAPLYAHLLLWWIGWFLRLAGISGGAFIFCSREAFQAVGGFDEKLFGAEDVTMSWALKRHGRFVLLWQYVDTSGRRMRGTRGLHMLAGLLRMALFPGMLRKRAAVKKIWYESERDDRSDSLFIRTVNVCLLLIMLAIITGPVWNFIPESVVPRSSPLGQMKLGIAILGCHVGLAAWPSALYLTRELFRQPRWIERSKLIALILVCLWCAWGATPVVLWFWSQFWT